MHSGKCMHATFKKVLHKFIEIVIRYSQSSLYQCVTVNGDAVEFIAVRPTERHDVV